MSESTSIELEFPLLRLNALSVEKRPLFGENQIALRRVTFDVDQGQIVALCGESGSGKTTLIHSILGTLNRNTRVMQGHVLLDGESLLKKSRRDMRKLRRTRIALVDRDVASQLNPHITVGQHLRETLELAGRQEEIGEEKDWSPYFYEVGIVEPELVMSKPCRELTGLMIQRVMLLSAIFAGAELLLCDQPTAKLDSVSAKHFFEILCQLRDERKMGILLTMNRLRGVEHFADWTHILCEGGILESGPSRELIKRPDHDYTRELYQASPDLTNPRKELPTISKGSLSKAEKVVHENFSNLSVPKGDTEPAEEEQAESGGSTQI